MRVRLDQLPEKIRNHYKGKFTYGFYFRENQYIVILNDKSKDIWIYINDEWQLHLTGFMNKFEGKIP